MYALCTNLRDWRIHKLVQLRRLFLNLTFCRKLDIVALTDPYKAVILSLHDVREVNTLDIANLAVKSPQ